MDTSLILFCLSSPPCIIEAGAVGDINVTTGFSPICFTSTILSSESLRILISSSTHHRPALFCHYVAATLLSFEMVTWRMVISLRHHSACNRRKLRSKRNTSLFRQARKDFWCIWYFKKLLLGHNPMEDTVANMLAPVTARRLQCFQCGVWRLSYFFVEDIQFARSSARSVSKTGRERKIDWKQLKRVILDYA